MNIQFSCSQFMVIDDFLPEAAFEQMWRWFHVAPFFPNDMRGLHGAWRLDDGRVMRGPDVYYGAVSQQVADANNGAFACPTGTGIDAKQSPFSSDSWIMPDAAAGDMVLYPSFLLHGVPPNDGGERISLALNAVPERLKSFGYEIRFSR